jgi:hypothetical protein
VGPQNRRAVRGLTSTRRRTRVRSPKSSSSSGPPQSTGTTFSSRSAPSSVSAPSGCHRSNPDTSNEPTPEHRRTRDASAFHVERIRRAAVETPRCLPPERRRDGALPVRKAPERLPTGIVYRSH